MQGIVVLFGRLISNLYKSKQALYSNPTHVGLNILSFVMVHCNSLYFNWNSLQKELAN
jgi:hypothetical protein